MHFHSVSMHRVTTSLFILALLAGPAAAENVVSMRPIEQTQKDPSQDDDRRDKLRKAAEEAEKGNQQKLMPNMMDHIQKAMDHEKKAEEARQQQDEGKAQDEEKKAQMEQMKAQQLKQQMDKNQDSANKNKDAANALTKYDDPAVKGKDANRVIVDKERRDKLENENASNAVTPQPPVHAEVARLDNFEEQKKALDQLIANARSAEVAKTEPEKKEAAPAAPAQEVVSNGESRSVSFNDNAPKGANSTAAALPAQEAVNASTSGGTPAAPPAPQDRLLSSGQGSGTQDGLILSMRDSGGSALVVGLPKKGDGKGDDFFSTIDKKDKERRNADAIQRRKPGGRKVASVKSAKPSKPARK